MTVQALILRLLQRIDPTLKSGTEVSSTVLTGTGAGKWATEGGDKFTATRVVDIYNEARIALANIIDKTYPINKKAEVISGNIIRKSDLQFASGIASKPSGYIAPVLLTDASGSQITILPTSMIQQVSGYETASNRMVFDFGTSFTALTGLTNIPNASNYVLYYYGITAITATDITNGTSVETFNDAWHPTLIEVAVAIANGAGNQDVNALALKLIGAQ